MERLRIVFLPVMEGQKLGVAGLDFKEPQYFGRDNSKKALRGVVPYRLVARSGRCPRS